MDLIHKTSSCTIHLCLLIIKQAQQKNLNNSEVRNICNTLVFMLFMDMGVKKALS